MASFEVSKVINMSENIKIFFPKKNLAFSGLILMCFVFLAFVLPSIVREEVMSNSKLLGILAFLAVGTFFTIAPFCARLEVGKDYIKTYFLGFTTANKIYASEVEKVIYGNAIAGGLGFGKAIHFWVNKNGKKRLHNLSEMTYGKETIAYVKQVLEANLK